MSYSVSQYNFTYVQYRYSNIRDPTIHSSCVYNISNLITEIRK